MAGMPSTGRPILREAIFLMLGGHRLCNRFGVFAF